MNKASPCARKLIGDREDVQHAPQRKGEIRPLLNLNGPVHESECFLITTTMRPHTRQKKGQKAPRTSGWQCKEEGAKEGGW